MDSIVMQFLAVLLGITFSGNIFFFKRIINKIDVFEDKLEAIHKDWYYTKSKMELVDDRIENIKLQLKEITTNCNKLHPVRIYNKD